MDLILIGKKSFNRNDVPHVIYCGQSRADAFAAAGESFAEFPFIYFVGTEPRQRITSTVINPPERAPVVVRKQTPEERVLPKGDDGSETHVFPGGAETHDKEGNIITAKTKVAKAPKAPKPPKPPKE